MKPSLGKAIFGGLAGTVLITLIMYYVAPLLIGGPMDIAATLAGFLGVSEGMGMFIHFVNGTVIFPLIYVYLLYGVLPGPPWQKGLWWGLVLWLLAQVAVMPIVGGGFFSSQAGGLMAVLGSLIGHAVYGIALGAVAGQPVPERHPIVSEPKTAE